VNSLQTDDLRSLNHYYRTSTHTTHSTTAPTMAPPKKQPSPAAAAASAFRPQQAVSTAAGGAASLAKKDQHQQSQSQQQASSQSKPSSSASSTTTSSSSLRNAQDAQEILSGIWNNYVDHTPQRVKLVDAFMAFLVVVGVLQFVYCVIAGNYVRSYPTLPSPLHGRREWAYLALAAGDYLKGRMGS